MRLPSGSELVLGMACGLLAGYAFWGRAKPPEVPAATQAQISALRADSARFRAFQDSAAKSARDFLAKSAADSAKVAGLTRAAARSRHLADSLAEVASRFPNPDSGAVAWREAYQARSQEADSLRTANGLQFQAMRGAMATANLCLLAQKDAEGRMSLMQSVQDSLLAAIRRARGPSRVTLGIGAGYGATLSGGQIRTGPTVALQVNYALRLPKPF